MVVQLLISDSIYLIRYAFQQIPKMLELKPCEPAFENGKADQFTHQLMRFSQNIHHCLNSCHLHPFYINAVYFS